MAFSITYAANRFPESVVISVDLAFFIAITQAAVNMRFIADGNNLLYLLPIWKSRQAASITRRLGNSPWQAFVAFWIS
mgnify:CR=1 FL=1